MSTVDEAAREALRILEAAGIEGWNYRDDRLASAVVALTEHKRQQDAKAERESEDAKVQEFRDALIEAKYTYGLVTPWGSLSEFERNDIRTHYRAARKFFEES